MQYASPRQIEIFVQLVACGSLRGVGELLHLSQPAASMALADLERLVGGDLFDRVRGRLHLNPRGRALLPLAKELLERHREFARFDTHGIAPGSELRIGASNTVGNYRIGELLAPFARAHPGVRLRMRVENTRLIAAAVLDGSLDVGCVEGPVVHAELQRKRWREDLLVVCAAADHPLAGRRGLVPADFHDAHWVLREPGSATREMSERLLAQLPPPAGLLELDQAEAVKQAVVAGLGLACLPEVALADAVAAGRLAVLDTPFAQLRRTLSLLWQRDQYQGAALRAFLASITPLPEPAASPR